MNRVLFNCRVFFIAAFKLKPTANKAPKDSNLIAI